MKLYPAIDIKNGNVVRLTQGDFARMDVFSHDPLEQALRFKKQGAQCLHIVDLDGAQSGIPKNLPLITTIVEQTGLFVQCGGGIRSLKTFKALIDVGVQRVILGTSAVESEDLVKEILQWYPDQLAVGVDVRDECIAIHGWKTQTDINADDFLRKLSQLGVHTFIYTDIAYDGMMNGIDASVYQRIKQSFDIELIASGGIRDASDIENLKRTGINGAIIGKSLYAQTLSLPKALAIASKEVTQ